MYFKRWIKPLLSISKRFLRRVICAEKTIVGPETIAILQRSDMETKELNPVTWSDTVPRLRCFACAPADENPLGLHLRFDKTETGATTSFRPLDHFQSYPGYVHGGIVAAVLDETMAYAGLLHLGRLPFTRSISIEYRGPVAAGAASHCVGILEKVGKASFEARSSLADSHGVVCATATGRFFMPTYERASKMMPGTDLAAWRPFLGS